MLTARYMTSVKNLPDIMKKIVDGTAPSKFTLAHLKGIGFKSSYDQAAIPLLKDLKFLTPDGAPTSRYHSYRDKSKSKAVLGEALREAYEDLFHVKEDLTKADKAEIKGRFTSVHNVSDSVAQKQTATFLAFLSLADISKPAAGKADGEPGEAEKKPEPSEKTNKGSNLSSIPFAGLRYNIEVHLPPTKDVEVYNAIFKSLKEHLLDD